MSKRNDLIRLRDIMRILIEPYNDPEFAYLHTEDKLYLAFGHPQVQIHKRRVPKGTKITGEWWLTDTQRWLWQGHRAQVIRSGDGVDRVQATRSILPKMFCYVREGGPSIDIEALAVTWRGKKQVGDWFTVTVSAPEYERLDKLLGPRESACRHEEENSFYDLTFA